MSLSDRRTLLFALAALPLSACGFAPAYAPDGAAARLRGTVRADAPADAADFDFVARIEDRLGRAQTPRLRLSYDLTTTPVGAGITPTGAITRYTLKGSARYRLTAADGTEAARGTVENFTSWSTTGSTVATLAAEQDAYRRLMVILADQVVTRLIAAGAAAGP